MIQKSLVRVRDVMKSSYDLVDGMDTVADVLRNAKYIERKCFIVNKRHENDQYGIVLLSDIAKKVLAKDKSPERVNIYEVMSKPIIGVDPDLDIRYCARMFENFSMRRAPVVENKKVIGIIGYTDIVIHGIRDKLT